MSSIRTAKDKGNDLENLVYQEMLKFDPETTLTSNSGARFEDGDIANRLFRIECKDAPSQKSFSIKRGTWKKIQKTADTFSKTGIAVSRNQDGWVVVHIAFDEFMCILKLAKDNIDKIAAKRSLLD